MSLSSSFFHGDFFRLFLDGGCNILFCPPAIVFFQRAG
jgi:hypothetical protein